MLFDLYYSCYSYYSSYYYFIHTVLLSLLWHGALLYIHSALFILSYYYYLFSYCHINSVLLFILIGSNFRPPKEVFRNVKGDVNVNVKCYVKMLKCSDVYCSHSSASGRKGEPLQKMDKKRLNVYMKVLDNVPADNRVYWIQFERSLRKWVYISRRSMLFCCFAFLKVLNW